MYLFIIYYVLMKASVHMHFRFIVHCFNINKKLLLIVMVIGKYKTICIRIIAFITKIIKIKTVSSICFKSHGITIKTKK